MIRAITFLFQYQRERRTKVIDGIPTEYITVQPCDIKLAHKLCCDVMGRTLDELAPQTRNLLHSLVTMVSEACIKLAIKQSDYRFSQKDVRNYTGWSAYQVKVHLRRLAELEYVYCFQGRNGRQYRYELVYDGAGDTGEPFVLGVSSIEQQFDTTPRKQTMTTKVAV
jgi:hypothetical protein